jgi:hypothetical protein
MDFVAATAHELFPRGKLTFKKPKPHKKQLDLGQSFAYGMLQIDLKRNRNGR